jgi:hypothetical protein
MAQHLAYWRPLQARGIVIVLGPVHDPPRWHEVLGPGLAGDDGRLELVGTA